MTLTRPNPSLHYKCGNGSEQDYYKDDPCAPRFASLMKFMKILVAPDKFKESLTAHAAAQAIAAGVHRVRPDAQIDLCPVADGGEGTVDALVHATGGTLRQTRVTGPLGEAVEATWGMLGDGHTAVIEMAQAAGLALVPPTLRNPMHTTTRGVGELILAAVDSGATKIILGIGGSATTDGGAGMAEALGYRFVGASSPMTGGQMSRIGHVDASGRDARLTGVSIVAACDVTNPLTGPDGAAAVYGPQKGATPGQVKALEAGLAHLALLLPSVDAQSPGMGAAGGLGFGLVAFAGAKLERGLDLVLDAVHFDERVRDAKLVITGEGRLDGQSLSGKVCLGIAGAAGKYGVPTMALVGAAADDAALTLDHGLAAYHTLVSPTVPPRRAMSEAAALLEKLAARVVDRYL